VEDSDVLAQFDSLAELLNPPGDRLPRVVRHDLPPGYTGPTRWERRTRELPRIEHDGMYVRYTGDPIVVEEWVEMPGDPRAAAGPLAGQGRDWENDARAKYWELRGPAGPPPTQEAVAGELGTNARYLYEVLGSWRVFVKRAEATPPDRT